MKYCDKSTKTIPENKKKAVFRKENSLIYFIIFSEKSQNKKLYILHFQFSIKKINLPT